MIRCLIICAMCLTGCARPVARVIPQELLAPVVVTCQPGETSRALGNCALALRAGLGEANSQLAAIRAIEEAPR